MTGRFAPSPTGRMHLGNIYSALLSYLACKSQGGQWLLRIEDLDPQRSKADFIRWAEDDLQWLGLEWDDYCVQSERLDIYTQYLNKLRKQGLTYPCYCTRADILATQAPHESDGRVVYAGTCRDMSPRFRADGSPQPAAVRLRVPNREISFTDLHYGLQRVNLAVHCGDFILQRQDGAFAYQLAVVVDDALYGVNQVVRGRDLLLSSAQQLYLYDLLGFPAPQFGHLPLLCNAQGQRLCKRDKALDMSVLRQQHSPQQIMGRLAFLSGLQPTPDPTTAKDLLSAFSWEKIPQEDVTCAAGLSVNS